MIPDPVELGEDRAERWADKNYDSTQFRCVSCRLWRSWSLSMPMAADPYSPAICSKCADEQEEHDNE